MMRSMARRAGVMLAMSAALLGCQNPESGLNRGPTKAPGDSVPLLTIANEAATPMRELGEPNRPRGEALAFAPVDTQAQQAQAQRPAVPATQVQLPPGVTQAMVTEGKQIFDTSCFACHGTGGAGGPLAPPLNDKTWLHIDGAYDAIVGIVTNGVPQPKQFPAPMPPKGGAPINDQQVRAVAAYVYSISR
jgi:mono/diheme cytochrome c family protein